MRVRTAAFYLQRPAAKEGAARVPARAAETGAGRAIPPRGQAIGRAAGAVPMPMPGRERAGWST
jgi:hypothetical protein